MDVPLLLHVVNTGEGDTQALFCEEDGYAEAETVCGESLVQFPVAIIPAYCPGSGMVELVQRLVVAFPHVIVVDDGSGSASASVFAELSQMPQVTVLKHHINLGKGAALCAGLNHAAVFFPQAAGVVTLDADGQHLPADAVRVAECLLETPEALVLGCRSFDEDEHVPARSRFGNRCTRRVFRLLTGIGVSDTQTGLRGIPYGFIADVLRLGTRGYDFELDMLLLAHNKQRPIREIPIHTVYINNNASSHFNPLLDSLKIYLVFIRFCASSIVTALLDYLVFIFCLMLGSGMGESMIAARLVAGGLNFTVNRAFVFKDKSSCVRSVLKYAACVALMGVLSYLIMQVLLLTICSSVLLAKICSETLLYVVSFIIQREFIFRAVTP